MTLQTLNLNDTTTASNVDAPSIAIFGLPKPFTHPHTRLIQRNALASWRQLGPQVETILLGNDAGIAETAKEFEIKHSGEIRSNEHGTPLLSDAFRKVREMTDADILMYCNCDVILLDDLVKTIKILRSSSQVKSFVAFGRRTNLRVEREIDVSDRNDLRTLLADTKSKGRMAPVVCKEYFAFTRDIFQEIPDFAVGRGNWDNWMIANTKSLGLPVIDVSKMVTAIHQDHDYLHLKKSRLNCYVSGDEAKRNQKLAGGKNIVSGSTGTWSLGPCGLEKTRASWLNRTFWMDFHRFARMIVRLPFER